MKLSNINPFKKKPEPNRAQRRQAEANSRRPWHYGIPGYRLARMTDKEIKRLKEKHAQN